MGLLRRVLRKLSRNLEFYSLAGSAAGQLSRFYTPARQWLDEIADAAAQTWPAVPKVLIYFGFFFLGAAAIRVLLGLAKWAYDRFRPHLRWLFGYREPLYPGAERGGATFRRDILESLHTSPFMYGLLLAGYRLVFEEEQFLLEEIEKVATTKDLRFLFLDRDSQFWEPIATQFAGGAESPAGFKRDCEAADRRLRSHLRLRDDQVAYFDANLGWRLYIFRDRVYVSRYCRPPESQLLQATAVPILAFDSARSITKPMYDWFFGEFRRHCPPAWQSQLPMPPMS